MRAVIMVVIMSLMVSSPAWAKNRFFSPLTPRKSRIMQSCDAIKSSCERRHTDHQRGCGVLWEAAKESGGVWGMPGARERAQIEGGIVSCSL